MRKLESGALTGLPAILGIGGGHTQDETMFDDDNLQQVLDVMAHIRRRRSNLTTTGIFGTMADNTHAAGAADTVVCDINPYTAVPIAGAWPTGGVPESFDVWLCGFRARNTANAGNFTAASLGLTMQPGTGFNAGLTVIQTLGTSAAVTTGDINLAFKEFTQEVAAGAIGTLLAEPDGEQCNRLPLPFRIPRGARIRWTTRTAAAGASVYRVELALGLFPAGFGQDVVGSAI